MGGTVFLVGNGAVRNGWEPLKQAIAEALGSERLLELGIDPSEYLAYLVFELRQLAFTADDPRNDSQFLDKYRFRSALLKRIARSFERAADEGSISLMIPENPEFRQLFEGGATSIVTTNWDRLLHREFGDTYPIICLHGCIDRAASLYLPTEICIEPYRELEKKEAGDIREAHEQAYRIMLGADRIVLWGVSLSIYDAELGVLIARSARRGSQTAAPRYVVVDPCDLPARRLEFLTGTPPMRIRPYGARCGKECCRAATDLDIPAV